MDQKISDRPFDITPLRSDSLKVENESSKDD